jgi:hypothetical protein
MIEEIEDIVDPSTQASIEHAVLSPGFPWYRGTTVDQYADSRFNLKQGSNPYQFVHSVTRDSGLDSGFHMLVDSILDAVRDYVKRDIEVLNLKVNFLPLHTDTGHHYPHVDIGLCPGQQIKSLVYYVNHSDGDTYFFDQTGPTERTSLNVIRRVSPQRGRAVLFDSDIFHASSSPVQSDKRIVINIVFKLLS